MPKQTLVPRCPPLRQRVLCWTSWLGLGCLFTLSAHASHTQACGQDPGPELRSIANNLWVWQGVNADINRNNLGHVGTSVVLLDKQSATVVDPGPSASHAQQLQQAIRCQLHARVTMVINTHAHAEHVLGNSAFTSSDKKVPIAATQGTQTAMRQRCPQCLAHLGDVLGAAALKGTRIAWPTRLLKPGDHLRAGQRTWEVLEFTQAHTESDLVLWNADEGILLTGGLVYTQRLPELAQGSIIGWIQALAHLQTLEPRLLVGVGSSQVQDLQPTQRYLCDMVNRVWAAMDQGLWANDATIALTGYDNWAGYVQRQSFNQQRVWRELEPLWMSQQTPDVHCQTSGGN